MDRGSVERNIDVNMTALQRAATRNGNQNPPVYPPASVTGDNGSGLSRAVGSEGPYVGTNGGE